MKQINSTVIGTASDTPYLTIDNGHTYHGQFESPTRCLFFIPDEEPPWGATVFYGGKALRFYYYDTPDTIVEHIPEHPGAYEGPVLQYGAALPRLQVGGPYLYANGQRWTWAMMTGFCDYQLFLTGNLGQLRAALQQAKDLGSNGRRVLGMMHFITHFDPRVFGERFYTEFAAFVALEAEYGQRVHFDVFADNQIYKFGMDHWARVCDVARSQESVIIGAGNEYQKNGFNPFVFPYPGVLSSQGSSVADTPPPLPGWGLRCWHGKRRWPKVFNAFDDAFYVGEGVDDEGHRSYPQAPIVHDEPIGFAEIDIPERRSTDPRLAANIMLQARANGAGATFHSEDGIFSRPLGPTQQTCARAFFDAQG